GAGGDKGDRDGVGAAVIENLLDAVAEQRAAIEAAIGAFVIGEARQAQLPGDGTARRPADKQRDRGCHSGDRAHTAGDLFDVHAWLEKSCGHVSSCSLASRVRARALASSATTRLLHKPPRFYGLGFTSRRAFNRSDRREARAA